MLTTKDNPFNPYLNYDEWTQWDRDYGYFTPELIARVSNPSVDMDDDQRDVLYLHACLFIMEHDMTGMYTMVEDPDRSNNEIQIATLTEATA